VTVDDRLVSIYAAVGSLGFRVLVMGGHAVRFYGVDRTTIDYDLHLVADDATWSVLGDRLSHLPLFSSSPIVEGSSWRPDAFRRLVIGRLPDGREERLEVWRRNHLLAAFDGLWARRTEHTTNGAPVAFLGIDDLIRSKETERESDWRDISLLEEIADERRLLEARPERVPDALCRLRSRRGYERAVQMGILGAPALVADAWRQVTLPITAAFLAPMAPAGVPAAAGAWAPDVVDLITGAVRRTAAGSARHHALVEAVRRLYKQQAMATDRADKERAISRGG
jgi:hypothetical protein